VCLRVFLLFYSVGFNKFLTLDELQESFFSVFGVLLRIGAVEEICGFDLALTT